MSITSEIRLRVRKEGDVVLNQLSAKLNDVASRSTLTSAKFKDLSATLRQTDNQIRTKSINGLNDYARAWRELANSVDVTSREFREATREAQRFEQAAAKAQGRRGGGRAMAAAKGVGAVAASGIFGGPEGAIGALIGLPFGAAGAAVGGAIGAQVGAVRQQLGGTATYAAEIAKQRLALKLVTKEADEYQRALAFVDQTSRKFAIPQEVITRQFTKLTASVKGAGGSVADAEKAFLGVAAGIRGTGGGLQDLDSALTATSQVFSKGKVSAEELRQQIGERLPGAFTLFAESMGMTPQELDKALEKGQVSLQDFQGFAEKLFKDYGEAAKVIASGPEAAGDRLQTALSRLSESVGNLLRPIGAAFQTEFAKIVIAIDKAARKLADFLGLGKGRAGEIAKLEKDLATTDERLRAFAQLRMKRGGLLGPVEYAKEQELSQRRIEMAARLGGLQAAEKAAAEIKTEPPKGLPGIDPSADAKGKKAKKDISRNLAEAQKAALAEINPIQKSVLDFEAKILAIREAELLPNKRSVQLAKALADFKKEQEAIGNKIAAGNVAEFLKGEERKRQIEETIQNLEIEAGVIDKKQARQIEKERLIAELQQGNNQLTEEQLQRIDNAYEGINKKTSESMQLFKQIGENVVSTLSDAFMNLFDQAKSLREVLSDLLRSTARLFVEFGLRAGMKSVFPSLFADGGIMTGNGPLPLKRYARGGIANSPQMAMFGEGSTPEAYVPLPDGRSIPVKMKGGGDVGNVVVNVDAKGTSVQGNQPNSAALGRAIGAAVQAELIKQKRPGGLLA
jgi:tape measure domain-containing protein